jgi:hypothetical protein
MKNSRLILAVLMTLLASPASARADLCETAANRAAGETGVPVDVLQAIALTETGRQQNGRLRPWPWAANTEGRGHWFADRSAALAFLHETLARGQNSIDLGCFQINLRWHGAEFASPEEILDPMTAARYAARHLANLHDEFGSWEAAAGAYHSRTPRYNSRYRARFREMRATLDSDAPVVMSTAPTPRTPPSSLFTGTASGASLVPVNMQQTTPLIALRP